MSLALYASGLLPGAFAWPASAMSPSAWRRRFVVLGFLRGAPT
jgi:hypothetical protein